MEIAASKFDKYILVCENERTDGKACCMPQGLHIREALKSLVKSKGLADRIRVSRSGCLDVCADGPSVLIMPDNVRLKAVGQNDIERVLELAMRNLSAKPAA